MQQPVQQPPQRFASQTSQLAPQESAQLPPQQLARQTSQQSKHQSPQQFSSQTSQQPPQAPAHQSQEARNHPQHIRGTQLYAQQSSTPEYTQPATQQTQQFQQPQQQHREQLPTQAPVYSAPQQSQNQYNSPSNAETGQGYTTSTAQARSYRTEPQTQHSLPQTQQLDPLKSNPVPVQESISAQPSEIPADRPKFSYDIASLPTRSQTVTDAVANTRPSPNFSYPARQPPQQSAAASQNRSDAGLMPQQSYSVPAEGTALYQTPTTTTQASTATSPEHKSKLGHLKAAALGIYVRMICNISPEPVLLLSLCSSTVSN